MQGTYPLELLSERVQALNDRHVADMKLSATCLLALLLGKRSHGACYATESLHCSEIAPRRPF